MKADHDFSKGKRGAVLAKPGKTRVTLYLDDDLLAEFRARADRLGKGYQTLINETLRAHFIMDPALDAALLRKILRQELKRATKA